MIVLRSEVSSRPGVSAKKDQPVVSPTGLVVLKEGMAGLRFGPVVTGQVALGKDGCGY